MENGGLKISRQTAQYLWFGRDGKEEEIRQLGESLDSVNDFRYLNIFVTETGELEVEVSHRVYAGWMHWRKVS